MMEANPLGVFLAVIFVSSMGFLFFWMFRVPPAFPLQAVQVHGSVEALHKILVPVVEFIPSERAVELACRLGNGKKADLVLCHVIVVPYTLPLDAPMPDREKIAEETLELGCIIARRYGNDPGTRIVRHRIASAGILQVADEERVDAIVLGVGAKSRVPGEWGKTSEEILRRANCEVILDRVPIATKSIPVGALV
jgi:nucleotide-binding universal stress UspA family protein